ncbi:uncharacterized protein LOC109725621 isoform X2 [Ananas comosus]|uniref:Uncharacterized protein LOC109725621 isoform X2 n=1 Tax=Ananas comosus TaxID=4615 RepID=A0A6P5GP90_ANACO|nr:uncharacterized protein LOC109725621 isoform X2 [Ananas comosus]XP_020110452.1 uncharacterized protein LOC109725621 isoform X2 [Ananas comosus]
MATARVFASPSSASPPQQQRQKQKQKQKQGGKCVGEAVYVAAVPLRAPKGPAQMLFSAAYSLGFWDLHHFMVIIKPLHSQSQAYVFDFQPQDPEDVFAAISVPLQRPIPGVILKRKLQRVPKSRCWFVGFSDSNAVDKANKFSEKWPSDLIVGKHDCRHYTNATRCLLEKCLELSFRREARI